jgi:gliding motility-associated-like protein
MFCKYFSVFGINCLILHIVKKKYYHKKFYQIPNIVRKKVILALFALLCLCSSVNADNEAKEIWFQVVVNGSEESEHKTSIQANAPLTIRAYSNFYEDRDESLDWQWCVYPDGSSPDNPILLRREEILDYTFSTSGKFRITIPSYAAELTPLFIEIYESELTFPNTFTPNGDGKNDTFQAKVVKSIVEFRGIIFNRWGKKLYEWDNPNTGWDGTYNGKTVNDGVYYLLVKAKGADGHEFNIKKDVNVLTSYDQTYQQYSY